MSDFSDWDNSLDAAIESYPLAPLPSGFVNRLMAQVEQEPRAVDLPRFRLQFLDVALPAFLALFALMVVTGGIWLGGQLNAAGLANPQSNLALIGQIPPWFGVGALAVLGEVTMMIMVGVRLWLDGPFLRVNQL